MVSPGAVSRYFPRSQPAWATSSASRLAETTLSVSSPTGGSSAGPGKDGRKSLGHNHGPNTITGATGSGPRLQGSQPPSPARRGEPTGQPRPAPGTPRSTGHTAGMTTWTTRTTKPSWTGPYGCWPGGGSESWPGSRTLFFPNGSAPGRRPPVGRRVVPPLGSVVPRSLGRVANARNVLAARLRPTRQGRPDAVRRRGSAPPVHPWR